MSYIYASCKGTCRRHIHLKHVFRQQTDKSRGCMHAQNAGDTHEALTQRRTMYDNWWESTSKANTALDGVNAIAMELKYTRWNIMGEKSSCWCAVTDVARKSTHVCEMLGCVHLFAIFMTNEQFHSQPVDKLIYSKTCDKKWSTATAQMLWCGTCAWVWVRIVFERSAHVFFHSWDGF